MRECELDGQGVNRQQRKEYCPGMPATATIPVAGMPTISSFYGILIRMFYNDHAPPHFHARYGEFEATIEIENLTIIEGELPSRALRLVTEWASVHRVELMENWRLCRANSVPAKIEPLT